MIDTISPLPSSDDMDYDDSKGPHDEGDDLCPEMAPDCFEDFEDCNPENCEGCKRQLFFSKYVIKQLTPLYLRRRLRRSRRGRALRGWGGWAGEVHAGAHGLP